MRTALRTLTTTPTTRPSRLRWDRIIVVALDALAWLVGAAAIAILMGMV